ncbi:hypothetical protein [Pararhodospirillum photometricum]|uniref:Uncharacterized protein n=1 Tax=Pararhodospirillum photometricum DSM 122 TaxID=1150469 RepID=H6SIS9_PARPM|nr:hypothetical protein [Pararhodospirillum photometricum]CCG06706.1 Putative uncharacterized protein [Pararhodospirillum photometricum DSM 122]
MRRVSQAEFARLHGVSRKTVTLWKTAGYLAVSEGQVDIEASDKALAERRLGRFKDVTAPVTPGNASPHVTRAVEPDLDDLERQADAFIERVLAGDFATLAEAERVKENALAVKNLLAVRQQAGALVEVEVAERLFFEASRAARDAWLNWPSRVAPLVGASLGVEADKVTEVLTAHVHAHLSDLGEPEADFHPEG